MLCLLLPELFPEALQLDFLLLDGIVVVGLQGLDIAHYFKFDVFLAHLRFKDKVNELLELKVLRGDVTVARLIVAEAY